MSNQNNQVVCQNRKARFEYEVIETLEAGIILTGTEIKSVRQHHVSLDGAFAVVANGEVTLVNCNIDPYKQGNIYNHEPKRQRRLLLHKSEITKFAEKAKVKGFTLIPLSMYLTHGIAKIELAICRGRQVHDKRQVMRQKDIEREMRR
jgi:SsrA-binding protein